LGVDIDATSSISRSKISKIQREDVPRLLSPIVTAIIRRDGGGEAGIYGEKDARLSALPD